MIFSYVIAPPKMTKLVKLSYLFFIFASQVSDSLFSLRWELRIGYLASEDDYFYAMLYNCKKEKNVTEYTFNISNSQKPGKTPSIMPIFQYLTGESLFKWVTFVTFLLRFYSRFISLFDEDVWINLDQICWGFLQVLLETS